MAAGPDKVNGILFELVKKRSERFGVIDSWTRPKLWGWQERQGGWYNEQVRVVVEGRKKELAVTWTCSYPGWELNSVAMMWFQLFSVIVAKSMMGWFALIVSKVSSWCFISSAGRAVLCNLLTEYPPTAAVSKWRCFHHKFRVTHLIYSLFLMEVQGIFCSKVLLVLDAVVIAKVHFVLVYKIRHRVKRASENEILLI